MARLRVDRYLAGAARSQQRFHRFSRWLSELRERGIRDGFLGGSRAWMAVGALTWTMRLVYLAAHRRPQTVYRGRLKKGESVTVIEHPAGWRP
jgi:hypothetical protein